MLGQMLDEMHSKVFFLNFALFFNFALNRSFINCSDLSRPVTSQSWIGFSKTQNSNCTLSSQQFSVGYRYFIVHVKINNQMAEILSIRH